MVRLGINIDHIATLRQARLGYEPSVIEAALTAERAGADGITIHLREDRRHIQDNDVYEIKKNLKIPLNLEMAVSEEIIKIACDVKPANICLVPEKRAELTTEGGLDVERNKEQLKKIIKKLQNTGSVVSLFINPDKRQITASKEVGAGVVELHTGAYANANNKEKINEELITLIEAGRYVIESGLVLNAGHGLNYINTAQVAKIKGMHELNIGHSIISRAVFVGLERAIQEMKKIINNKNI
ncbi:MAG: pyridoxine 5'-phosphate synthase [Elusimicrobiota bacterium]